jgi:hypothetical protein
MIGLQRYPSPSRNFQGATLFKLESLGFKSFSLWGSDHCDIILLCCNKAGTFLHIRHAITRSVHPSNVGGKPSEIQSKNLIFQLLLLHMNYANMTIQKDLKFSQLWS